MVIVFPLVVLVISSEPRLAVLLGITSLPAMVDVNCSADGRNVVTNVHQTGKTELLGLVLFRVDVIILLDFVRIDVVSNRFQGNSIVLIPFMRRGFCVGMVLMKRAYFDV